MSSKRENEVLQNGLAKKAKANEPAPGAAGIAAGEPGVGIAPAEPMPMEPEVANPVAAEPATVDVLAVPMRMWLKCEKCGSVIARRFKVCHRGHLACGKCVKSRRTKCPRCKVKYVTDSPVVVKKLLDVIREHDAKKDK